MLTTYMQRLFCGAPRGFRRPNGPLFYSGFKLASEEEIIYYDSISSSLIPHSNDFCVKIYNK